MGGFQTTQFEGVGTGGVENGKEIVFLKWEGGIGNERKGNHFNVRG